MEELNRQEHYLRQHRIVRKSMIQSKKKHIDIYRSALDRLQGDAFIIKEAGSQYIAKLIYQLYHERKLLEKYHDRPSYQGYWDLSDINNPHYYRLGDSIQILKAIRESIIHSCCEEDDADINELIYDLSDLEISRHNEDKREYDDRISYKKILL